MSKNKYYDEHGNQIRSKPKKQIYNKFSFWFILILSIVIIITVINLSTDKSVVIDKHTVSNNEESSDRTNDTVDKENEINSDYNNDEQESNNDNNTLKQNVNDFGTEQDLLDGYDQLEIDYARIILMHGIDVSDIDYPTLHINDNLSYEHSTFPTALGNFDFIRDLKLTLLHFEYYDGETQEHVYVYYNPHGDGNITTYQLDDIELVLDRKVNIMEQEVLDTAETIYIDPSEPDIVANFIDNVEFIYE